MTDAQAQILVLGMHRSGTSVTTSVLNGLGAYVGEAESLTPANPENPRGFFERRDARSICDALLHGAGADWWRIAEFNIEAIAADALEPQKAAIEALVASLDEHGTWALKEPRLCLLLPVFRPYLSRPFVVFVYRNPLEVAQSLRKRNGFPTTFGLALWEAYNVSALQAAAGLPALFLDYADLLADPNGSGIRIAAAIKAQGADGLHQTDVASLVDTALYRERSDPGPQQELVSGPQLALWRELRTGSPAPEPRMVSEAARVILAEYEADERAKGEALRSEVMKETEKWQAEGDALRSGQAGKDSELAESLASLRALSEDTVKQLREIKRALKQGRKSRESIQQEVKSVRADVDQIRSAQGSILQRLTPDESGLT